VLPKPSWVEMLSGTRFITESVLQMEADHSLLKLAYSPGLGASGIAKREED